MKKAYGKEYQVGDVAFVEIYDFSGDKTCLKEGTVTKITKSTMTVTIDKITILFKKSRFANSMIWGTKYILHDSPEAYEQRVKERQESAQMKVELSDAIKTMSYEDLKWLKEVLASKPKKKDTK